MTNSNQELISVKKIRLTSEGETFTCLTFTELIPERTKIFTQFDWKTLLICFSCQAEYRCNFFIFWEHNTTCRLYLNALSGMQEAENTILGRSKCTGTIFDLTICYRWANKFGLKFLTLCGY